MNLSAILTAAISLTTVSILDIRFAHFVDLIALIFIELAMLVICGLLSNDTIPYRLILARKIQSIFHQSCCAWMPVDTDCGNIMA
jgi:hypothetical protein